MFTHILFLTGQRRTKSGENGRALLQIVGPAFRFLRLGLLFGSVIDDAVDHAVVVLQLHLRIFQIILRCPERGQLLIANAVEVVTGYHAAALDGNDVADGQAVSAKSSGRS